MGLKTSAWWHLFLFSGVGSCVAELATMPLDVSKTRLQLQGSAGAGPADGRGAYRGMIDALRRIALSEGPAALWSGIAPALVRQATYGSARIGMYEPIKGAITAALGSDGSSNFLVKVLAGTASGAVASAAFNPTDRLKVLLQADGAGAARGGVFEVLREVIRTEGAMGLYKGATPTAARAALVAAAELSTYDEFKGAVVSLGMRPDATATHLLASAMAGIVATVVSSPADVIKSRVMGGSSRYPTVAAAIATTLREEGPGAFYRGFVPNASRIVPHVCIAFMVIERLRYWLGVQSD